MRINIRRRALKRATMLLLIPLALWAVSGAGWIEAGPRRIDPSHTCMGSNQVQEKAQAYAEVEGKRYYGCTDMCIANLRRNPGFRYGTDPLSGNKVDKATALIAVLPRGELLYFESEENLLAYRE